MGLNKLSIVIPCYREKVFIRELVKRVKDSEIGSISKEIIIVDDASGDGTEEILKDMTLEDPALKVFFQKKNLGKGAALRLGFENATGDAVLVQDADLEYDPRDYKKLLTPISEGRADVVIGSRFRGEERRVLYFWHMVGNKVLTLLSNMLTNLNLTDMESCYKVFNRNILQKINLTSNRFGFEPEFVAKISKIKTIRIYEVPINYAGRTYAEGKKITWKDGLAAFYFTIKYNLFSRK